MEKIKAEKLSTQPYKGARDFYPEDMKIRNYIFNTWKQVCLSFGFEEYDFPIIEPLEIFAAKSGSEIVNDQLFSFEDRGGRKLAVRPELTPGTVRMIAQKFEELPKPVRWFMIGNNWRFEKPQLGRGREFYQLEANIFGEAGATADFEIFSLIISLLKAFGAKQEQFSVRFSDRRLVAELLGNVLGLSEELQTKVRRLMDKKGKLSQEDFDAALLDLGLKQGQVDSVNKFLSSKFQDLPSIISDELLNKNEGYLAIQKLVSLLKDAGLYEYCRFDPSIIRGFDYSDGFVYEVYDENPNNRRSLFGGERFDRLINIFGDYELPATGFALGDYTFLEFLKNWNLLPKMENTIDFLVTVWPSESDGYQKRAFEVATKLRESGKNVVTWLGKSDKLEKQLKYADRKQIGKALIIGETELKDGTVAVKDMIARSQETVTLEKLLKL
ncbi:MAG: histidine--tRNA ligase [candidate division WWE3 bacterium]|nr:histidine--tRNA ligase [candidate division WWE3 bacterium]